ncbi:MAG TPA: phosphodiester glycosidase family protein [Fimbriimonadaceae bacterium]|nr:phosphodiester glycosidase family protein [Fimbriimonadaceae bacterium]
MSLVFALAIAAPLASPADTAARPIHYESFKQDHVYYHAVVADMSERQVTAKAVFSDRLTSAWTLIGQSQPAAAITGTFFGYKSQLPVADVVIDGEQVASGAIGSAVGVDWYGNVKIFDTPFQQPIDLYGYRDLLRGTVRLIKDGHVSPNPKAQHFTDPAIWGRAPRTGIGLTADKRLVMMATKHKVTLSQFGRAMKRLGVKQAVALDGGNSAMLYYRGDLVIPPERKLSNMFALYEEPLP